MNPFSPLLMQYPAKELVRHAIAALEAELGINHAFPLAIGLLKVYEQMPERSDEITPMQSIAELVNA